MSALIRADERVDDDDDGLPCGEDTHIHARKREERHKDPQYTNEGKNAYKSNISLSF
jgi:hypothetical protein